MRNIFKYTCYSVSVMVLNSCGIASERRADMERNGCRINDSIKIVIDSTLKDAEVFTENKSQITNTYIFEYK